MAARATTTEKHRTMCVASPVIALQFGVVAGVEVAGFPSVEEWTKGTVDSASTGRPTKLDWGRLRPQISSLLSKESTAS